MFRPAGWVVFKRVSRDIKYNLGMHFRRRPPLGKVYKPQYPVDINPYQQVFMNGDFIEPHKMLAKFEQCSFPRLQTFPGKKEKVLWGCTSRKLN